MALMRTRKWTALGLAFAVVLVLAGLATANRLQQANDDIIRACVNNNSGELKIIGLGEECQKNSTLLEWNEEGPLGPEGLQGPEGAEGPTGPEGPEGPAGAGSSVACELAQVMLEAGFLNELPADCDADEPPPPFEGTYVLGDFIVADGNFELLMGATPYWGYEAEARVSTIGGLNEIVMGPIQVGETVAFDRCRQSGSRSTKPHHMTIEALGIDHNLDGISGTGGGTVGVVDDPTNNCEFTFTEPGEYLIDDSTDPGAHGVAVFIVCTVCPLAVSPGRRSVHETL